jgi:hypothetical protein
VSLRKGSVPLLAEDPQSHNSIVRDGKSSQGEAMDMIPICGAVFDKVDAVKQHILQTVPVPTEMLKSLLHHLGLRWIDHFQSLG